MFLSNAGLSPKSSLILLLAVTLPDVLSWSYAGEKNNMCLVLANKRGDAMAARHFYLLTAGQTLLSVAHLTITPVRLKKIQRCCTKDS